jgi:hypothetical protein
MGRHGGRPSHLTEWRSSGFQAAAGSGLNEPRTPKAFGVRAGELLPKLLATGDLLISLENF